MKFVRVVSKMTKKGLENEINMILGEQEHMKLIDIKFTYDNGSYAALIIFEEIS